MMTEQEWLTCREPELMRQFICNQTSDRKLLLYMIAWCGHTTRLTKDSRYRRAIEVAERCADGLATEEDFKLAGSGTLLVKLIPILMGPHYHVDHPRYVNLLHDVIGNPFRVPSIDVHWLAWNDGTVSKMAQSIYDSRSFDELPILADALEEAGCEDGEILDHLRGPGPHVRGCWVVDLLLDKK